MKTAAINKTIREQKTILPIFFVLNRLALPNNRSTICRKYFTNFLYISDMNNTESGTIDRITRVKVAYPENNGSKPNWFVNRRRICIYKAPYDVV